MKRITLVFFFTLLVSIIGFGQTSLETISYKEAFVGYKFTQIGVPVSILEMPGIMKNIPETREYLKKVKINFYAYYVINYTGGFLIGWPVGTAIAGGDANWTMAAIGGGLILLGMPFYIAANNNAIKAVDIFNSKIKDNSTRAYSLGFGFTQGGIGFSVKF
jgi:hypothetical protein